MISMNRDHEPPRLVVVHNYREFGASAVAFATNAGASSRIPIGVLVSPSERGQFPMTIGATFPRRSWDPNLYAFPIMAEFAMTQWQENLRFADPPTDQKAIAAEIVKLIEKAKLRDERAAEILEQSEDPSVYWAAALMITAGTHPFTWTLMATATLIGRLVCMHFKLKFNRARPVQLYPALMPPVPTPPHPAYPNAHAMQSALITSCLKLANPVFAEPDGGMLDQLAHRIAENREVAGLHYPSDTKASFDATPAVIELLRQGRLFNKLVDDAKAEWPETRSVPM